MRNCYDLQSPASPDPSLAMMRCLSAVVLSSALACPLGAQVEIPTLRHPANQEGLELQTRDLNKVLEGMALSRARDYATDQPILLSPFRTTAKALAEATALFMDPPLPDGDDVVLLGGRYLVALGSAKQQAWTDRFLSRQPEHAGDMFNVDLAAFFVDTMTRNKLGLSEDLSLDRIAGKALLGKLEASEQVRFGDVQLATYSLEEGTFSMVSQTAYIRDFELDVNQAQALVASPVVDQVEDGFEASWRVVRVGDDEIGVWGQLELSELMRPLAVRSIELPGGQPVEIQVPSVLEEVVEFAATVRNGGFAFVRGPSLHGRHTVLVLTASAVRLFR